MSATTAPYGSWPSPITAASLTAGSVGLSSVAADGGDVFWLEGRATEGGRSVLVRRRADGSTADVTPAPFNVRSRVHEYGGGAYAVRDQVSGLLELRRRTALPAGPGRRFRAADADHRRPRRTVCCGSAICASTRRASGCSAVREDHRAEGEAVNTLVRIDLDAVDQEGEILVDGHDFIAAARFTADGSRVAFLTWEHPDMPWDATVLWTANVLEGAALQDVRPVARHRPPGVAGRARLAGRRSPGGAPPTGPTGGTCIWSRPTAYVPCIRWKPSSPVRRGPWAATAWAQTASGRIACRWRGPEQTGIGLLDPDTGDLQPLEIPGRAFGSVHAIEHDIVCLAGYVDAPDAVVRISGTTVEQAASGRRRRP